MRRSVKRAQEAKRTAGKAADMAGSQQQQVHYALKMGV